ncbi:helix-turn-helix transcriptional regulator [Neobacillus drentensis]|uniref:helix-turn-helix domain-containing protein n=1 Tax=Neobacillus drentensis TaxID=220684 RepID=UPI002FFFE4EB
MSVGEIIKFYRQKEGLTQEDLGRGICSVTHVSKIERGQTPYASEIISLFSERLQIDIEKEVKRLENLGSQLHYWHKVIIMQRLKEVEEIKKELETITIIESSSYAALYYLLQARYYLIKQDIKMTYAILMRVQNDYPNLPAYEKNLYRHVWGIYYLFDNRNSKTESYQKAITILKEIDRNEYGNLEYYYHLAAAYQWMNSYVLAYSYAEKALWYYKEIDNFLGAIMAESIMLISIGSDIENNFQEVEAAYHRLIHNSELLNKPDKKTMLLNNLGYKYYRRKEYEKAKNCFKESLRLVTKPSGLYLQRWYNYLKCCFEGKLMRDGELLKHAREGLSMAKKLDTTVYKIVFKLLIYRIEENYEQYYQFIEKEALPYFESSKSEMLKKRFGKELYQYYVKKEQYDKAVQLSNHLIDTIQSE